jgi:hypothetical protein
MAKTEDFFQVRYFLEDYLSQLLDKLDQLDTAIVTQALSCPKTMELVLIESQLNEYVRLHHLDLKKRKMNFHINQFKNEIYEKALFYYLSSLSLTTEQVILYLTYIGSVYLSLNYLFSKKVSAAFPISVNNN